MIVLKFGGTSLENSARLKNVVQIVQRSLPEQPIVVCSAIGKTTRGLLDAIHLIKEKQLVRALAKLGEIENLHFSLASEALDGPVNAAVEARLTAYFAELKKLFEGVHILNDFSSQIQDKVLSYGELLSSVLLAGALEQSDIQTQWLDSRELIVTDSRFGAAQPDLAVSAGKVRPRILPLIERRAVPVLQGFIGSDHHGRTTTLGFEGSDYTASLLGHLLDAREIHIWKTVNGLMTADPAVIPGALTVSQVSYREARELTFFGAKCLHAKAVFPAERKGIPLRIFNTSAPENPGTLISSEATERRRITSISYLKNVSHLKISLEGGYDFTRSLASFKSILDRWKIAPLHAALTEEGVSALLPSEGLSDRMEADLKEWGHVDCQHSCGLIALVGNRFHEDRELKREIAETLSGLNVLKMDFGLSSLTYLVLLHERELTDGMRKLHLRFFENN